MCEDDPPQKEPLCVQACSLDALTLEEVEEEIEEEVKPGEMEIGLKSLIDRYGVQKIVEAFARMSQKN